jgi:hypothetical protein
VSWAVASVSELSRYVRFLQRKRQRRRRLSRAEPVTRARIPLKVEMESESSTLLLAFGGMNQRIGMPPFEFFSMAGEIPVKRIFARDLRQAWYHCGVPDGGENLQGVRDHLQELIVRERVERVIVAGASAGGYAALVFGTLLGADVVLAFAPQTVLDLDVLGAMDDHRWDDHLKPLRARGELDRDWIDLREALPGARVADTRYEVYYDVTLSADRLHAERLRGLDGLVLYGFGHGGHGLVRRMRDSGALERVVRRALLLGELPDSAPAAGG